MLRRAVIATAVAVSGTLLPFAAPASPAPWHVAAAELTVDHVVIVMRHGVRPPTKAPPMPAGTASEAWPSWPVPPGWLTPHGAEAVQRLGAWDAGRAREQGLIPKAACPAPGAVVAIADSDQRTIATADAWLSAFAPNCGLSSRHYPQDKPDPAFAGIDAAGDTFDPATANAAVGQALGPGGIAALDRQMTPLVARLNRVLCRAPAPGCGLGATPSAIRPAAPGSRPKLSGILDRASTAAQILLLEYADGKPAADVGWGRAGAADVEAFSAFHALEFRLLARPRYIAAANLTGLLPLIGTGLSGPAKVTLIAGHDTNIANLGGLLGVHWKVPGFAADDPSPGGALVITRLHDVQGRGFVRLEYRSQTLGQIRSASPLGKSGPSVTLLQAEGCHVEGLKGGCTEAQFRRLTDGRRASVQ